MSYRLALLLAVACAALLGGEDAPPAEGRSKPKTLDERKRAFTTLQQELEASRPLEEATQEEIFAWLELAVDGYGKFAKEHAKTAEGFEAAASLAELLTQTQHPEALKYYELAVETAPAAGVDVKRVAICYAMLAGGRLQKSDIEGAKAAVAKIKDFDAEMHQQFSAQLDEVLKQVEQMKQAADQLQPGKEPFPIEDADINGQKFSLAALKGKVVIVDFWASWCAPCLREMPALLELQQKSKDKGLAIVGISLDKDAEELRESIKQNGITWPILCDNGGWNNAIARKWSVRSIPKTFVLDKKGIIRHVDLRGEELSAAVQKLLDEKP